MSRSLLAPDVPGRGRFRLWIVCSLLFHGSLLVLLGTTASTETRPTALPAVVQVALLAPSQAPAAVRAPDPVVPKPAPRAEPKPPPPPPEPPKVVLPEKPKPVPEPTPPKAKPEPEPPKPEPPKPRAKPRPTPKPAPEPEPVGDYDDVLAALREQAGEKAPSPREVASAEPQTTRSGGVGIPISAEEAAWRRHAKVRVHRSWVLAPGFRMQPLETEVRVKIGPGGDVIDLKVLRSSGNPWFDESVERAIRKSSPLPRPPESGSWNFIFRPEDLF